MAEDVPDPQQLSLFAVEPYQMSLPDYQVRESTRARHVSLKVSGQGDLEVVVPVGFDHRKIPAILDQRRGWITRTQQRLAQQQATLPPEHLAEQPSQLELRSRQQIWQIHYSEAPGPPSLTQSGPQTLTLGGRAVDADTSRALLRDWLRRRARMELEPWLQSLSQQCDLAYSQLSVRGQTSRWGSCSTKQSISLNFKLLFLPPPLVDYVLIHELCHTVHMNHSPAFWALVQRYCPQYDRCRAELKQGWQYVPRWVDGWGSR